jgi:seryl-tRNA synthetase
MLNEQQYIELMTELQQLSTLRKTIANSLQRNSDGTFGQQSLFPTAPEEIARWMNELGDIEVEIRKKIRTFTPHLPEIKQAPHGERFGKNGKQKTYDRGY